MPTTVKLTATTTDELLVRDLMSLPNGREFEVVEAPQPDGDRLVAKVRENGNGPVVALGLPRGVAVDVYR